jgi:uncharacterized protein (TIGR02594 family)
MISESDQHLALTKAFVYATFGFGTAYAWETWIKNAGELSGNLIPIGTLIFLVVTIYFKLFPRSASVAASVDPDAIQQQAASVAKKVGTIAGLITGVAGALMTLKSGVAIPPANGLVSRRDIPGGLSLLSDYPPTTPDAPDWYQYAERLVGTAEALPNGRANPAVKDMFGAVDYYPPATTDCRKVPWCAAFANDCFKNVDVPGTRSAAASSFAERPRLFGKIDDPVLGCVVVLTHHVGFYAGPGKRPNTIRILGGNQGDAVCFADFKTRDVIGYFWPRSKWESRTGRGAIVAVGATGAGALATGWETVTEVAQQIQQPLEATGHPKAIKIAKLIGLAVLLIGVAAAVYTYWRNSRDYKEGRT